METTSPVDSKSNCSALNGQDENDLKPFDLLPTELVMAIFHHLDNNSKINSQFVCHNWYEILNDHSFKSSLPLENIYSSLEKARQIFNNSKSNCLIYMSSRGKINEVVKDTRFIESKNETVFDLDLYITKLYLSTSIFFENDNFTGSQKQTKKIFDSVYKTVVKNAVIENPPEKEAYVSGLYGHYEDRPHFKQEDFQAFIKSIKPIKELLKTTEICK